MKSKISDYLADCIGKIFVQVCFIGVLPVVVLDPNRDLSFSEYDSNGMDLRTFHIRWQVILPRSLIRRQRGTMKDTQNILSRVMTVIFIN
jgi:hypothetical protein